MASKFDREGVLELDEASIGLAASFATPLARTALPERSKAYLVRFVGGGRSLEYRPRLRGGAWYLRMRVEGRPRIRFLALSDDLEPSDGARVLSYEGAMARAREIFLGDWQAFFAKVRLDLLPDTLRICPIGDIYTVGHALRDYLAERHQFGARYAYKHVLADMNAYIVGDLSSIPCAELDVKQLKAWFNELKTSSQDASNFVRRSPNSLLPLNDGEADRKARLRANSVLVTLKAALNLAWRDQKIESDAAWRRIRPYRGVRKARSRILDGGEVKALLAAAPRDLGQLITGALLTGCRVGELLELRPSNFNYEAGRLFVHASKTGRSRNIILSYEGISFFERMTHCLGEKDPIFVMSSGRPWARRGYTGPMRLACLKAGLHPPAIFHDLRHTYASNLIMAGVSIFVVAEQLGHADCTQVIKTYGHISSHFATEQLRTLSPLVNTSRTAVRRTEKWHKGLIARRQAEGVRIKPSPGRKSIT